MKRLAQTTSQPSLNNDIIRSIRGALYASSAGKTRTAGAVLASKPVTIAPWTPDPAFLIVRITSLLLRAATAFALSMTALAAGAADYPTPKQGDWVARDFKFHTGEVMPELHLHYTTVGAPSGQPVEATLP